MTRRPDDDLSAFGAHVDPRPYFAQILYPAHVPFVWAPENVMPASATGDGGHGFRQLLVLSLQVEQTFHSNSAIDVDCDQALIAAHCNPNIRYGATVHPASDDVNVARSILLPS